MTKQQQQQTKKAAIVAAARQLCRQHGVPGFRMEQLATAAGVAKGTLYLYFSTKDELLQAIAAEDLTPWALGLGERLREVEDAGSRKTARILAQALSDPANLAPSLLPHLPQTVVAELTGATLGEALAAALPELGSDEEARKLWRAVCALYAGLESSEFEEAAANLIRGTVRGQKARKKE